MSSNGKTQGKDIKWINTVRALCMISVYLLHSEFYYGDAGFSYGYALTPFYVNAFFFVSGYLLFGKYMDSSGAVVFSKKDCQGLLANVAFRLVVPTLLFSTLIYVPKTMFHGNALSFGQYFRDVWGGTSYWFTSALAVAQVLLAALLSMRRGGMAFYVGTCGLLAFSGEWLRDALPSPFPWNWQMGMTATFLMSLGGTYRRHEARIDRAVSKPYVLGTVAAAYLASVVRTNPAHPPVVMPEPVLHLWNWAVILCGITCVVALSRLLPRTGWLEYIGKNSIMFYFLSGVTPALFGNIVSRLAPDVSYALTLAVASAALLAATGINELVRKRFPFLTDLRRLHGN